MPIDREPDTGEPEHFSGPSAPKWPFFLGDVLLVAAALVVWATQPELSAVELAFCLFAVGAGAVLFAVPYALEFMARAQTPRGESAGTVAALARLDALEGSLPRQAHMAAQAAEQASRALTENKAAVEAAAKRWEARLAPLAEAQKNLEAAAAEARETAGHAGRDAQAWPRELEKFRKEHEGKLAAAEAKIAALGETLAELAARLEKPAEPAPVPSDPVEPAADAPEKKPAGHGTLLAKALATVQPATETSAVSDIIQSRPRRPRKPKAVEAPPPAESPTDESVDVAQAEPVSPETSPAREGWDSLADGKFDTLTAPTETTSETATATVVVAPAPTPADEPLVETRRAARAKAAALLADDAEEKPAAASKSAEPAQVELLTAPAAETAPKRRHAKADAAAATLVARVLIGIGNKPFVRGEGPGLSPDKGVPMEFVEIGQWRWVAPGPAKGEITLRILKNDEVPATGEAIVLAPGKTVEVSPVFPN